jgi:hypothetical protein
MTGGLAIEVPVPATGRVRSASPGYRVLFDALFGAPASVDDDRPSWRLNDGQLAIRVTSEAALSLRTRAPVGSSLHFAGSSDAVAAAVPALGDLVAVSPTLLQSFLFEQLAALDHIGINLAAATLSEADWRAFVASVDRSWPVHVLDLPGSDIVAIALASPQNTAVTGPGVQALEIVYDRRARQSSWHVCTRVKSDKAATERAFPAPRGAYKPGDEPYFRSVTAAAGIGVAFYLDLAFADGALPSWTEIVAAMGRRWS